MCFLLSCTARPAAPDAAAPPAASADVQAGPGTTARAGPRAEPASFRPFALLDDADPAALEVPAEGAREPLVLIVEAGSYECPHTRKAEVMIAAVLKEFPDVARCWLHNPLPGQKRGALLALAASAAQRQGRFWEFHRLLMEAGPDLDEDRLLALARRAELDVGLFLKDLKRPEIKEHVERNQAVVAALGLAGVPVFVVNGRLVLGVVEPARLSALVGDELAAARALRDKTASLAELHQAAAATWPPYQTLLAKGILWQETIPREPQDNPWTRWDVAAEGKPDCGEADAAVTVVAYLDFTDAGSKQAWAGLRALAEQRGKDVRVFLRVNPTLRQPEAMTAAAAAVLARQNGKLTAFADAYFAAQGSAAEVLATACQAGGVERCAAEWLRGGDLLAVVEAEKVGAVRLLAAPAPVIFVNGLRRAGTMDASALGKLIDDEAALVRELAAKGMSLTAARQFLRSRSTMLSLLAPEATTFDLRDVPFLGASDKARLRLVVIWDDSSPWCRELWPHLGSLLQKYRTELAIYQLPYDKATAPAPPPALFLNGHRVRSPLGLDIYSLSAAVEEARSAPRQP